jgi:hypothetical protein
LRMVGAVARWLTVRVVLRHVVRTVAATVTTVPTTAVATLPTSPMDGLGTARAAADEDTRAATEIDCNAPVDDCEEAEVRDVQSVVDLLQDRGQRRGAAFTTRGSFLGRALSQADHVAGAGSLGVRHPMVAIAIFRFLRGLLGGRR